MSLPCLTIFLLSLCTASLLSVFLFHYALLVLHCTVTSFPLVTVFCHFFTSLHSTARRVSLLTYPHALPSSRLSLSVQPHHSPTSAVTLHLSVHLLGSLLPKRRPHPLVPSDISSSPSCLGCTAENRRTVLGPSSHPAGTGGTLSLQEEQCRSQECHADSVCLSFIHRAGPQ